MVGLWIAIAAVVAACVGLFAGLNVGAARRVGGLRKAAYDQFEREDAELTQRLRQRESEQAAAVVEAQRDLAAVHKEAAETRRQADAQAADTRRQAETQAGVELERVRRM